MLSQFAKQVDRHFAKKKRRGILAEAREIIVHADHNTTTMQFSTEKGTLNAVILESEIHVPDNYQISHIASYTFR